MSVDRHGVAWIVYNDGALFKASITDATCRPAPYVAGARGFRRFGMGFVTDAPGATTEKLFIASADESRALGYLDTAHDLTPRPVGTLTASGEIAWPCVAGDNRAAIRLWSAHEATRDGGRGGRGGMFDGVHGHAAGGRTSARRRRAAQPGALEAARHRRDHAVLGHPGRARHADWQFPDVSL